MSDDAGIYDGELIDLSVESFVSEKPESTSDSDQLSRCKAGANQSGTCLPQNECQRSSAERNQSTTKRSYDENKTNSFKNREENKAKSTRSRERKNSDIYDGSQLSSKRISKLPRFNTNISKENCEDGNSRTRRSENASSDRPQSRKNQPPAPPIPDDSYDYDDYQPEYYMDADESSNWQQNNYNAQQQEQQNFNAQQQQQQNHNTQQCYDQNQDEYQMNARDISTSDVAQRATSFTGDDIWQAKEDLVRIENQRLCLLQCIEEHQRALVEKTQQLLKNEQEQIKLRSEYEKRKMAEFQKQMNARMPGAPSQCAKLYPQANGMKKPDKKGDQPKTSGRQVSNSHLKRKRLMYQPPSLSSSTESSISVDEVNGEQRQQQQYAQRQEKSKKRISYVPPSETDDSCFSEDFDDSQTPDTNASMNPSCNENQRDCQPDISTMANRMCQNDNRKSKNNNGTKNKQTMKKAEKTRRQNFTNEFYYLTPQENMDDSQVQSSNCDDCKLSSRSLPNESNNNGLKRCKNRTQ